MRIAAIFSLLFVAAVPLAAQNPGVWAFTGATVHRVSGPPIEGGTVIVRGGLIDTVTARGAVPAEATVIDVTGMHLYPGLIDAHSRLLVREPEPASGTSDGTGMAPPETSADTRVITMLDVSDAEALDAPRSVGITTARISAKSRVFDGQTPLLNLGRGTPAENVIREVAAQQISFVPRTDSAYPASLMGVIAHIRQTMLDAAHQREALRIYESSPGGHVRPVRREELTALSGVLAGEVPVVLVAQDESMIRRALLLARELGLSDPIISGAVDAWSAAPAIASAGASVILPTQYPKVRSGSDGDEPLRLLRRRVNAPTGALELQKAGVRFAFGSHGAKPSVFLDGVRLAVRAGLPAERALRALTLDAARMFQADRQIGSIDAGKIANLLVYDRPIFEEGATLRHLVIDGRRLTVPEKDETEAEGAVAGRWDLTVDMGGREMGFIVTLEGSGTNLSGRWTGDAGSGDLSNVTFEGDVLEFVISTADRTTGDTSDWRFSGTVDGDQIAGTVSIETDTFQFSGRRVR